MTNNLAMIIGIELLTAVQGLEFRKPLKTSATLAKLITEIRKNVAPIEKDRSLAPDIEKASLLIRNGKLIKTVKRVQFPKLESR